MKIKAFIKGFLMRPRFQSPKKPKKSEKGLAESDVRILNQYSKSELAFFDRCGVKLVEGYEVDTNDRSWALDKH